MKATLAPSGTGFLFQLLLALALASATLSQVQVQTVTSIANATSSSSVRPTFTLNSTLLPTSSPNATAIANSTLTSPGLANSTTNSAGPHLDTRVDATFGVLGGLLVVSGIPMGFWGAKNRWSSFFLAGTYAGSMIVGLLIIHFGVVGSVHEPSSALKGLFVFASLAGGLIAGAAGILFWKGAAVLTPAFGGFGIGVFVDAVRSDGLIRPVGLRYILFIAPAALSFSLSTVKKFQPVCLLLSTAALGSMGLVIGVDCFTTAGLKEFYVFNLGLSSLFPKLNGHFNLSLGSQIELGCTGAIFLCMVSWQFRVFDLLKAKTLELKAADRSRALAEEEAGTRAKAFASRDLEEWEEKYGHGRRSPSSAATILGPSSLDLSRPQTKGSSSSERQRTSSYDFLPPVDFHSRGESSSPGDSPSAGPRALSNSEWETYLSSRQVSTTSPVSLPSRRPTSMARPQTLSPSQLVLDTIISDDGHAAFDDDTPLGIISPSASPRLSITGPPARSRPDSLAFPSSDSMSRLPSRPQSTAFPSSMSLNRPQLAGTRRNTMIDLSEESMRGTHERPAKLDRRATAERIIVGEWAPRPAPPPAAKIMDLSELESKHRRKLSEMQAPVLETVKTEAELATARAAFEQRKQREAAEMKAKERAARETSASESRRHSVGALLDKLSPSPSPSPAPGATSPTFRDTDRRRQSSGGIVPSASASVVASEESPRRRQPSLGQRRESQRLSGLSKVAAWQESVTSLTPSPPPRPSTPSTSGVPHTAAQTTKSKLDWLAY